MVLELEDANIPVLLLSWLKCCMKHTDCRLFSVQLMMNMTAQRDHKHTMDSILWLFLVPGTADNAKQNTQDKEESVLHKYMYQSQRHVTTIPVPMAAAAAAASCSTDLENHRVQQLGMVP